MNLNINDDRNIENPTAQVARLEIAKVGDQQFAVLSRADEDFIQFYRNDDGSLDVEYRAGDADKHFAAPSGELTPDDVAEGFCAFIDGTFDSWQRGWNWEKVDFDEDFEGDTGLTHYVLHGTEFPRIRVGKETTIAPRDAVGADSTSSEGPCVKCQALAEHFHEEGCEAEECPRCHGTLVECECE